jgi:hypothetical protein
VNSSKAKKSALCGMVLLICTMGSVAWAQSDPASQPPADVSGHWSIYARNPDGSTDTKTVDIKQNGNQLTGKFKGPHQSGKIEGTVNGNHVVFSTKTREVLTFRGNVQGNTIRGHFGIRGRHGEFEANRLNQ